MNRTLKRPMFRIGGSVNSGITSGLDQPRKQYSQGTDPYDRALSTTERAMKDLERFKGENTRSDKLLPGNVPNFLTSFGLNLMSQTPRGKGFSGLLSTAATAAKEPFQTFQAAQLAKKDDEEMEEDKEEEMEVPMPVLEELVKQIAAVIEEKLNPMDARIAEMESKVEKMSTEPASTKTIVKSNSSAESFKAETPTARMVMNALSNPKR